MYFSQFKITTITTTTKINLPSQLKYISDRPSREIAKSIEAGGK